MKIDAQGMGGLLPPAYPAQAPKAAMGGAAFVGPAVPAATGAPAPAASQTMQPNEAVAKGRAYAKTMEDQFNAECQTCKNRTYQDGSNDPGVSFKMPQHINPGNAAAVVSGHEQQHVTRNAAKAQREGGEVISSTVQLHGATCPECGRFYISGGTTRTTTAHKQQEDPGALSTQHANGAKGRAKAKESA